MMIRQTAFAGSHAFLKGALHCHTTRSDGRGSPEEVMKVHAENGYDFMAITDHRIYNYRNFAPETGILVIPATEIDRDFAGRKGIHCFHTVLLGSLREDGNPFEQDEILPHGEIEDQFSFQKILDEMHRKGQLSFYCHPEWSGTPVCEFDHLSGNIGMEIWNSGCVIENGLDSNAAYWDELLYRGQRLFGFATDDGHAMDQHCHGWVMVNADKNVKSVLEALKQGAFYSSCGPVIRDFVVEDGVAKVDCSPVAEVVFRSFRDPGARLYDPEGKVTHFEYKFRPSDPYIRVTVRDKEGNRAWTNPIFLDETQKTSE